MKKRIIALLLAVMMLLSLTACAQDEAASPSESAQQDAPAAETPTDGEPVVYTIAMATALTDFMAEVGNQFKNSVEMAMEEVNAYNEENGINWRLELEAFDDKCDVTEATLVAQRIATGADDYLMVFGHLFSSTTLACMDTYAAAGLPIFVPTANGDDIQSDNMLRMCLPAKVQGPQMAACAINNCGMTKIALIYAMSDYGVGMADQLTSIAAEKGVEVVVSESYTAGTDKDFSAILTKVEAEKADGVVIVGDYNEGSMIISQAGDISYFNDNNIPFVSDATMFADTFLERIAGSGLEDQVFLAAGYNPYSTDGNFVAFNEMFIAKFDQNTTEPSVYGYDMVNIVAAALYEGATKETLVDVVKTLTFDDLACAVGEIQFAEDGNRTATSISVIGVKDNAFYDGGELVDMTGITY